MVLCGAARLMTAFLLASAVRGQAPAQPPRLVDISESPDAKRMAYLFENQGTRKLEVRDRTSGSVLWTSPDVVCYAFTSGGDVLSLTRDQFQVHAAATGQPRRSTKIAASVGPICAISPDGQTFATQVTPGQPVIILETATGKSVRSMERFSAQVFSLSFSPDGRWLASGEFNRVARVWEVATGIEQDVLPGHRSWVPAVRFSPAGRCLITSSYGGFKVWELSGERVLQEIEEPESTIDPFPFSYANGRVLFATPSRPEQLQERPAPCPAEQATSSAPALRILAVGISLYADPNRNLPVARNDATDLVRLLQERNAKQYRGEQAIKIYDRLASRQAILHGLERLASAASNQDVVVIYYAGHGVVRDGEFYLLPADALGPESVNRISAAELATAIGRIPAGRKLVIVDACQSGGAMTRLAGVLSTAPGASIHLMASSLSSAIEMRRLNHGIMTYALLESLGKTAFTANQLMRSVKQLVPEISRKSFPGKEQTVTTFSRGPDFPIASR